MGWLPTQASLYAVSLLSHTPQSSSLVRGATVVRRLYVDDVYYGGVDILNYGGKF